MDPSSPSNVAREHPPDDTGRPCIRPLCGGGRQQPRGALELLLTRVFGALCGAAFGVLPAARAAAKVATRRAVQSGKIPSLPGIIEPGTGGGPPAKPGAGGLMAEVTAEPPLASADLA